MSEAGNTTSTKHIPLRIEPIPNGGFIVSEGYGRESGFLTMPLLACTTLGEALDFIKGRLAPAEVKAAPVKAIDRACARCGSLGMQDYCSLCNRPRGVRPNPNSASGWSV